MSRDRLLYQGRASIRIVTKEGKVIYIDPFAGEGYDIPADLILVTHEHFDHNKISLVEKRNAECRIIRSGDAVHDGIHEQFELGYAKVLAVEAGNNPNHSVDECVGYVIVLESGVSIYISGDTSTTKDMDRIAKMKIDYAFYCCDGEYNMDMDEAVDVARKIGAKHSIPYHVTGDITNTLDRTRAERFCVEGRMILEYGQEIEL